jgi:exodeoxyribonuclease III
MKIATFNINNVNKRLGNLLAWIEAKEPDVVCLQELKAEDGAFPAAAIGRAGYRAVWRGQRSWNGVAILAREAEPILTRDWLPGDPADAQARYIEAAVRGVLIASIYLPNGNPQPGPKFEYKMAWFERLIAHAAELWASGLPVVLAGDYNVVPTEFDIYPSTPTPRTRSSSRSRVKPIAASSIKGGRTRCGRSTRTSRCSPSGATSSSAGAPTTACASTISSSARI